MSRPGSYTLYFNHAEHLSYDWRGIVFRRVGEHLCSKGIDVRIETCPTFVLKWPGFRRKTLEIRDSLAFLQEDRTGNFQALDCHDWVDPEDLPWIVRDRRCRRVLKCQYSARAFRGRRYRVLRPWTYFESHWPLYQPRLAELRRRERHDDRLFFRGNDAEERGPVLRLLKQGGRLYPEWSPVPFDQYVDEICRHRILLSLPGMGEFCHRDLEGFATGTPVLRPRLPNTFHDDLVPDHHYVSVDTDIEEDPPEVAAGRIEAKYREVINDSRLLGSVADNASAWYDRNVRLPESMELTRTLLGFTD